MVILMGVVRSGKAFEDRFDARADESLDSDQIRSSMGKSREQDERLSVAQIEEVL